MAKEEILDLMMTCHYQTVLVLW